MVDDDDDGDDDDDDADADDDDGGDDDDDDDVDRFSARSVRSHLSPKCRHSGGVSA